MFDRYYNFTTCIRSNNLAAIADAMTHILEQEEGCRRLTHLPEITIDSEQLRYLPAWERPRLWLISLCRGEDGWTIVKTWPNELFCARVEGVTRPRLSALAMQLGCDVFHFRVVRDICGILLEADATGHIFLSGWNDYEGANSLDETHLFYDEQINAPEPISQFSLLTVPQPMQEAMRVHENPEIARIEAEYERLLAEDPQSELLINLQDEVEKGYAERIDNALAEVIDKSKSCWYLRDLLYYVYAEPQQLEDKGAQLLYFQPPTTYNPHPVILLPPEPLSEDDEDESF
ncbi:hypothetical protein [Nostoc sp. NMS4]|uniref:hypothetical protein n=1 Tax=Nostoc sp. NMS4 TaxID=2815390 RepID=UPI0025D9E214|nr:hypothetical protein [Nostoc sp. NMS4]MBN3925617.1 hypothetical protein [Nostoc sp. NMS4]